MKILLIADNEERALWDYWSEATAERLSGVGLVLSAGDLSPEYLEFIVTMLNVPLVYVRGNHDGRYDTEPPQGCIDADGKLVRVNCREEVRTENGICVIDRRINILGLGGSMRYKSGAADMYTERQMAARVRKAERALVLQKIAGALGTGNTPKAAAPVTSDSASPSVAALAAKQPAFDILLTHAPCRGYGDMDDLPHTGFECFNTLLNKYKPVFHCYGHVHKEYGGFVFGTAGSGDGSDGIEVKGYRRQILHPSGTILINGSGYCILDI